MAVPGDDGRDDHLGALGPHAAGRLDQPRRDDVVQPLRLRRGRRLAAPHRRRAGAGRARATGGCGSRRARRPGSPRRRATARDAVRDGGGRPGRSTGRRSRSTSPCRRTRPRRCRCPTAARRSRSAPAGTRSRCTIPEPQPVEKPFVFVLPDADEPPVTDDDRCRTAAAVRLRVRGGPRRPAAVPAPDGRDDPVPAGAEFIPRPTNEQLARGGAFTVEERTVPGPEGAPEVQLLICRPAAAVGPGPALYFTHGGGMIAGTGRDGSGRGVGPRRAADGGGHLGRVPARARGTASRPGRGLLRRPGLDGGARR